MKRSTIGMVLGAAVFAVGFMSNFRAGGEAAPRDSSVSHPAPVVPRAHEPGTVALQDLPSLFDPTTPIASEAAIAAAAMRFDAGQLRALIVELAEGSDEELREGVLPTLIARWAELDPHAVLELAFEDRVESWFRHHLFEAGFSQLARQSPEDAREFALRTSPDGDNPRESVLRSMLAVLSETDPALALSWLVDRELVPEKDYERAAGAFYGEWAERDPTGAAASVLENPLAWSAVAVAQVWAVADPQAVASWAMGLESVEMRGLVLEEIIDATSENDGGAFAMTLLEKLFPNEVPGHAVSNIARAAMGHEFDMGLAWIAALEDGQSLRNAGYNAASIVVRNHPERLNEFLAAFDDDRDRRGVITRAVKSWVSIDPDAAAAWARALEPGADRDAAIFELLEARPELVSEIQNPAAVHQNDMAALAQKMNAANGRGVTEEWIDALPTSSQRRAALRAMYPAWADDPEGVIEYIRRLETEGRPEDIDRRRHVELSQFVKVWGEADPQAAIAWAGQNSFREEANEVQGRVILETLGTGDHELAGAQLSAHLDQLANLPEGAANHTAGLNEASAKISHAWARRDPAGAIVWVDSIADGAVRNMAAYQVANVWADIDPQAALGWGLGLPAGRVREQVLRATFDQWAGYDSEGARVALDSAGLAEHERAMVLEEFPK